ncbi:kelch-like protein 25 [Branchiostoma floridae]|uniref:Kelch-like protein 25 n=1 Tax=Branchiostoma floridae TaxID=7739 RepID=A0A9J7L4R0_BRAFL|nr:kelch-like protein 25 [Branchiostoma floridae]
MAMNFASSEVFYSLSVNQLAEIISHDELDVKEETTVWEAVVRWVKHSREDRLHHLPSILPHIRFNLLTSDDTAAILDHPLVREDAGSSEVIRNRVKETSTPRKRFGMDTMEMALLFNFRKDEILFMNPREGKYVSRSYHFKEYCSVAAMAVSSDSNIYMLARDSGKLTMFKYKHIRNAHIWAHAGMSPVFTFLEQGKNSLDYNEHLVEVDRTLYYLGVKKRSDSTLVRMRKYNWYSDQWQECSQLEVDGLSKLSAAVTCCSHLYFFTKSKMHRYDPSQDLWHQKTPPRTDLPICTAVAMGTEIFCTDDLFTRTMVYDTESDRWQDLQGWLSPEFPSHLDMSNPQFFVLENQLHLVLEAYETTRERSSAQYMVYVYDRSADAWTDMKATIPKNRYVSGGSMCHVARMYNPLSDAQYAFMY